MRFHSTIALAILLSCPSVARAQHDAERDATRFIAEEKFEAAVERLEESDVESERRFVETMLELKRGDLERAIAHAEAALELGLPIERFLVGPKPLLDPLIDSPTFQEWKKTDGTTRLIHGPMIGSLTDQSAVVWARASEPGAVVVVSVETPEGSKEFVAESEASRDNTARVFVRGLEPDTRYPYRLEVREARETPARSQDVRVASFKTFPKQNAPAKFRVAFGGGAGFIPEWEEMWDTIRAFDPHAMFMLGDNVYIDHPEFALTQRYCYYRRQSRPEWRRLTSSTGIFSIYDDHDFGTNDCIPGPAIDEPAWKRPVWRVFQENWANPGYGGGDLAPGCYYDIYIGDTHFIFLDGRFYRDLEGGTMLGPVQKQWLFNTLKNSRGVFKVLVSPVPWSPGVKPGSRDPWDGFPEERESIFSFIESQSIEGVFLVAADRHRTDLRTIERDNGYDLYEFESSKLTNRHTHGVVETKGFIWGYNDKCSFGLMRFDTTKEVPEVLFEAVNIDGEIIHEFTLSRDRLTF